MQAKFKIYRYDPEKDPGPYYQSYTLEADPESRILDCLNRIKWERDGSLSFRMSCGHGVCGSDGMKINGTCGLACQKLIKDYRCPEIVLEPLPVFKVLKDLVVDMDSFLEGIFAVRPYLIAKESEQRELPQSPEQRKRVHDAIRCILCACCTAGCPVMVHNQDYVGPASIVWMHRYIFDSRDEAFEERLQQANDPNGVWPCVNHFECTRVCPKDIPITRSINQLKKTIREASGEKAGAGE